MRWSDAFFAVPSDEVAGLKARPHASLVVYYDETCDFCTRIAQRLDRINWLGRVRFREAREHPTLQSRQYDDIQAIRKGWRVLLRTSHLSPDRLANSNPVAPGSVAVHSSLQNHRGQDVPKGGRQPRMSSGSPRRQLRHGAGGPSCAPLSPTLVTRSETVTTSETQDLKREP